MPKKLILGVALTEDPVEEHIIRHLGKLVNQNKQLKEQIKRTKNWVEDKPIKSWVPFDFYHFFCKLYESKFGEPFIQKGNLFHWYEKIETFILANKIQNEDYKTFIEKAFVIFNSLSKPSVGSICNAKLYSTIMKTSAREILPKDFHDLDIQLARENEKIKREQEKYGITPGMTLRDIKRRMEEYNAKPKG
jgi:hypothetical protein